MRPKPFAMQLVGPLTEHQAAMVTSTSTPASILMIICLTTSVGALRLPQSLARILCAQQARTSHSISRLWMRISYMSQVLLPSPQGVLRVVTFRCLVGRRTGPLTRRSFERARSISSLHTFSSDLTLRDVNVMRIRWIFCRHSVSHALRLNQESAYWAIAEVLLALLVRHGGGGSW